MAAKIKDALQDRLSALNGKSQLLVEKFHAVYKQKLEAEQRALGLEAEIRKLKQQIQQMNTQIEYLQVVSTISPSRDDLDKTKKILSDLVREINKCINDLTL